MAHLDVQTLLKPNAEFRERVTQFLALEAMLLDEGRLDEWLGLLADDVTYEIPQRLAVDRRTDEFPTGAYWLRDDKTMLRLRAERIATGFAHAETPYSRTVRMIGSIAILPEDAPSMARASSALQVYRHRGSDPDPEIFHARRYDRFRLAGDTLQLVSRTIHLAQTTLIAANIGIFL